MEHLNFREELHAIEAVIAGQGIGIFSNALVASELASGTRPAATLDREEQPQQQRLLHDAAEW